MKFKILWTDELDAVLIATRRSGIEWDEVAARMGLTKDAVKARWRRIMNPEQSREVMRRYRARKRANEKRRTQQTERRQLSPLEFAEGHAAADQRSYEILREARRG
jgi:transposase